MVRGGRTGVGWGGGLGGGRRESGEGGRGRGGEVESTGGSSLRLCITTDGREIGNM